jgi:uncharacterized protein
MALSMSQASVPVFHQMLTSLSAILDKAAAYATEKKIDPNTLLNARLYPNMFTLTRQVQTACDHAKGATARLAGIEVPKFADEEKTFDELKARIAKTLDFIASVPAAKIDGSEGRTITMKAGPNDLTFNGQTYLIGFALPNFFFHTTTAYDILRHNGLDIGKRDFIGKPA